MLVSRELISRLESSAATSLARMTFAAKGDVLRVGGGTAAFCGERNVLTQVVAYGMDGAPSRADWDALIAHYAGRCSAFEFKLSPLAHPEVWRAVAERATDIAEFETYLVRDTTNIPDALSAHRVEELPKDEVRAYVSKAAHWFFPDDSPPGLVETMTAASLTPENRTYVVREGQEIVGGASLWVVDGVGWLQGGAVDPDHRRRGVHRSLIAHRLAVAAQLGLDLVAQGASPGTSSQMNAQRNGFQIVLTQPSFWIPTG